AIAPKSPHRTESRPPLGATPSPPSPSRPHSIRAVPKVTYERSGAAAVLSITRPERRNAVDDETARLLAEGFRSFEADEEARALVLTGGDPEAFCAGADLKALAETDPANTSLEEWLDAHRDGPLGFTRLTPTKPTIAA